MISWLKIASSQSVIKRAALTALIVGIILVSINYGDSLLHGSVTQAQLLRMALTFLVPYCVSTYSSVSAILSLQPRASE